MISIQSTAVFSALTFGLMLSGCGDQTEEALEADTAEGYKKAQWLMNIMVDIRRGCPTCRRDWFELRKRLEVRHLRGKSTRQRPGRAGSRYVGFHLVRQFI